MFRKNDPNNELDADAWHPPFLERPVKGALSRISRTLKRIIASFPSPAVKSKPHRDVIARQVNVKSLRGPSGKFPISRNVIDLLLKYSQSREYNVNETENISRAAKLSQIPVILS